MRQHPAGSLFPQIDKPPAARPRGVVFARSPLLVRLLAVFLGVALCGCAGVRIEGGDRPRTESFQPFKVPDLFVAVLPSGGKPTLASSQPKAPLPLFAVIDGLKPLRRLLSARTSSRRPTACPTRPPTLVGTVELRI